MLRLRQVFDPINPVRFLLDWRSQRAAIARAAGELMTFLGDMAYDEARSRARACRHGDDPRGDRHWSKVAVEIAKRTGGEIGVKTADCYERDSRSARRARHVREVASRTSPILAMLADAARDQGTEVGLQNVRAHVRNAIDLTHGDPEVAKAGDEVCRVAAQLMNEAPRSAELIRQQAVERFRATLVRSLERRSASSRA